MKEYDVKITETLEKTVTVQAESHDAAEEQVRAASYNSEYILDSENFTGVAFGTTEEREVQKEQADTMNVLLVKPFMYPQAVHCANVRNQTFLPSPGSTGARLYELEGILPCCAH